MTATSYIFDADRTNFTESVLERSRSTPVMVDFWAAWCGPCRMLAPMLEKLVGEYQGDVLLAKLDTEAEQELAARYGIRSLPTIKMFKNGEPVDEFMGVQPESTIRAFIDRHRPRKSDRDLAEAATLHDNGETDAAIALLTESEQADPNNDHTRLMLATLYIDAGAFNDAREALRRVAAQTKLESEYGAISTKLEFTELNATVTSPDQLQQAIEQDPDDCESRLRLSAWALLNDEAELGLENLLEIVKRDRSFRDDAGRRYLLSAFAILGSHPKLVSKYRGLLARLLN